MVQAQFEKEHRRLPACKELEVPDRFMCVIAFKMASVVVCDLAEEWH